jgi:heptaprenylglyceryl phosphate synthase
VQATSKPTDPDYTLFCDEPVYAPTKNPAAVLDPAEQEEVARIHSDLHDAYTLVMVGSGTAVDEAGRQMIRACKRSPDGICPSIFPRTTKNQTSTGLW